MNGDKVTEVETAEPSESGDGRLIDELAGRAQAEGQLTGEGGLLHQLTRARLSRRCQNPDEPCAGS